MSITPSGCMVVVEFDNASQRFVSRVPDVPGAEASGQTCELAIRAARKNVSRILGLPLEPEE